MDLQEWQGLTLKSAKLKISEHPAALKKNEVLHMLNTLRVSGNVLAQSFKVGDVIKHQALGHPAIILKIDAEIAHCVILTTQETCSGNLMKCNSRFYDTSFVTSTVVTTDIKSIVLHGVYDCPSDIKEIRKLLKQYYKKLLRI